MITQVPTRSVVEIKMDAAVDTTEARFLGGLIETGEVTRYDLREIKRSLFGCQMTIALAVVCKVISVETGQDDTGRSSKRAVARRISRKRWRF